MRLILLVFLLIRIPAFGQERDLNSYLSNIVDLGGGDFGIITGEVNENTLSFITVGDSNDSFFSGISVKFYDIDFEATAYLVKTFVFGNYTLALYECEKPERLPWRSDHYDFFSSNSNSFRTFLDNGRSDNQWSNYREPVSLVNLSNQIASLRMKGRSLYNRGMPILNEQGSVVGMIASGQSDEEYVTFEAIDFSAIEKLLYEFDKCKYFKLIPFGQKITICAKEEIENLLREREEKRTRRQNMRYKLAIAPAFSHGYIFIPGGDPYATYVDGGPGFATGINLHFWPEQPSRLVLKPRTGQYHVWSLGRITYPYNYSETGSLSGLQSGTFSGIELYFLEVPIMWERVIKYFKKQNLAFALGYVPTVKYKTNAVFGGFDPNFLKIKVNDSAFKNRFLIELSLERRKAKWSLFYSAQLDKWVDPEYEIADQFNNIQPFESQRGVSYNFGAEFSWRLWGNWLLKER